MNPITHTAAGLRVVEACDADEHAANLTNWEQCYDQTTCGTFHGLLEEIQLPGMQVFRESTSQGMRQSCCVWPDAMWFGLPFSADITRINGRTVAPHSVLVRPGHQEFELVTPADYTIFGLVVRQDTLHSAAQALGFDVDWGRLQAAEILHPSAAALKQCLHTLSALLQPDLGVPADPAHAQTHALEALLPLLDTSVVDAGVRDSFSRRAISAASARRNSSRSERAWSFSSTSTSAWARMAASSTSASHHCKRYRSASAMASITLFEELPMTSKAARRAAIHCASVGSETNGPPMVPLLRRCRAARRGRAAA